MIKTKEELVKEFQEEIEQYPLTIKSSGYLYMINELKDKK
jgi:hypothetical protein